MREIVVDLSPYEVEAISIVKCGHKMVMVAAMSSMTAVKHGCKVRHGRLPNH